MKLIKKPLVIVGIDPGTTMGYAILDINGGLIKTDSARGNRLAELISAITYHGKPVLVGTDKAKCPELVYQFAAKTGAKIVSPYADLLISEKRVLTKNYVVKNDHEDDALSSALSAYKKYSGLLNKVDYYLKNVKKEAISDEVKRLLIHKEGLNINDAVKVVEGREEPRKTVQVEREVAEEFVPTKEDYLRLKVKLRRVEEEFRILKSKNDSISDELEKSGSEEAERPGGLASNRRINRILRQRERRIKGEERLIGSLSGKIMVLKRFLGEIGEKVLLKKLDNLTYDEFLKRDKILRISMGDVLLVENPNNYSQKTLSLLKNRVGLIISRKGLDKNLRNIRDFVFLDGSKLRIEEEEDFGLAGSAEIERLKRESNMLVDLLERYKESRKREG